jgi:hypothetical protein
VDFPPTASCIASTEPDGIATAVDGIVVGNFFARCDLSSRNHQSFPVHGLDMSIGVTRMVYVSFGWLHENNPPTFEVIAMALLLVILERGMIVYNPRIIDRENGFALKEWTNSEDTTPLNATFVDHNCVSHVL